MWIELFDRSTEDRESRNRPPRYIRRNPPIETQGDLDIELIAKQNFVDRQKLISDHYNRGMSLAYLQHYFDVHDQPRMFVWIPLVGNWRMNFATCVYGDLLCIRIAGLSSDAPNIHAASLILVNQLKDLCTEFAVRAVLATYSDTVNNATNNQFYPDIPATMAADPFFVPFTPTLLKPDWYTFEAVIA